MGRRRTSDTQRNKDKCFRGWHLADTAWKMTWLFCCKRLEGGGGCKRKRDHWKWRENRISSYMIGIFKEDGEEMTCLSEMSRSIKRVCNCIEGREGNGEGGRNWQKVKKMELEGILANLMLYEWEHWGPRIRLQVIIAVKDDDIDDINNGKWYWLNVIYQVYSPSYCHVAHAMFISISGFLVFQQQ